VLTEALAAGGDEAKRAFDAMMDMKKIDVAAIKAGARRGLTFNSKTPLSTWRFKATGGRSLRGSLPTSACPHRREPSAIPFSELIDVAFIVKERRPRSVKRPSEAARKNRQRRAAVGNQSRNAMRNESSL
jgi:hypothetical protein